MADTVLDWLVTPCGGTSFQDDQFGKSPALWRRGDAHHHDSILAASDVDDLIRLACEIDYGRVDPRFRRIELIRDGDSFATSSVRDIRQGFAQGQSIRINRIQRYWPPAFTIARKLSALWTAAINVNVYCTPSHTQTLHPHFDTHDVFALQISGHKDWQVGPEVRKWPVRRLPGVNFQRAAEPDHGRDYANNAPCTDQWEHDWRVGPGDAIYLPRGVQHLVSTGTEPSVHLTIGVTLITYADAITYLIGNRLSRDPQWRKALPGDDVHAARRMAELMKALADDPDDLARALNGVRRLMADEHPALDEPVTGIGTDEG